MHRKTSTPRRKGPLTDGCHLGQSVGRLAYPLCSPSPLREEQNVLVREALYKSLEDKNSRLRGEGTMATLHVNPVTQPPHKSLADELCG